MSGIDRLQTLKIDCPHCHGRSYVETSSGQEMCGQCQGMGMLEKEVPYKFETRGRWTREELADEFGMQVDDIKNTGNNAGNDD